MTTGLSSGQAGEGACGQAEPEGDTDDDGDDDQDGFGTDHAPQLRPGHPDRPEEPDLAGSFDDGQRQGVRDSDQGNEHSEPEQHGDEADDLLDRGGSTAQMNANTTVGTHTWTMRTGGHLQPPDTRRLVVDLARTHATNAVGRLALLTH